MSGRYTSYWNAFLFKVISFQPVENSWNKFKLVILCPMRGQCHVPLLFVALTDSNPKLVACPVILFT